MNNTYYNYMKTHREWELYVNRVLTSLGVSQNLKGYDYLMAGIIMAAENPDVLHALTKEFYPALANMFDSTPSRVERAIRHALEVSWSNGSPDMLDEMFGYTIGKDKDKPTNGSFVATISNKLRRAFY